MRTLYVGGDAKLRARARREILTAGEVDAQEVEQLVPAVQKARECTSAGAVGEIQLDLQHAMPCAYRVDGHRDLHAEAVSERQHVFECSPSQRALPGDGRMRGQPAAPTNCPAREREREPEAAADARGKDSNRHIGISAGDRVGQR